MSEQTFNRYELGRKTTTDVLESEKTNVDEIETRQMARKNEGRTVDYKKRHQDFLRNAKYNDENIDLNEVKKVQMQVYSSNSSEIYNLTSKTSILFTIFSIIFSILLFTVVLVLIIFNTTGYVLLKYDKETVGDVEQGRVLVCIECNKIAGLSENEWVALKDGDDIKVRVIKDVGSSSVTIGIPTDDTGDETMTYAAFYDRAVGVIASKMGGFGDFLMLILKYWYYFVGALFLLMVGCFVIKLSIDRHYNMLLINRLEKERQEMEKRRKFLSENIVKMQQTKNISFDNINILSEFLNVNKTPDNRREKKMKKLQKQLKDRQHEQIERIKAAEKDEELEKMKEKEKEVVEFLREEISAQEQQKAQLTDEEIEKRRQLAEETNKDINN